MFLALAAAVCIVALAFTFFVRPQDIRKGPVAPPWKHLEARKAAIYENLRDLQFEYRLGKLSDDDYARTKIELQAELAKVLAEIDQLKAGSVATVAAEPVRVKANRHVCPHCNAKFEKALKFCGECGKPMGASA
jgi:hypothetical protein